MYEAYSEITVMPREVGAVIFADAPSHPDCQYIKILGIGASQIDKAWLQVQSGFRYSWDELSHRRILTTEPPQSESEKFFAHLNNGEVVLREVPWSERSAPTSTEYRVVITPKEVE